MDINLIYTLRYKLVINISKSLLTITIKYKCNYLVAGSAKMRNNDSVVPGVHMYITLINGPKDNYFNYML